MERWMKRILFGMSFLFVFTNSLYYRGDKMIDRRNRLMQIRMNMQKRRIVRPQICYDLLGCFADPPRNLPLKRSPEHPDVIKTKFSLYTRNQTDVPESLAYGDDLESISQSYFDRNKNVKVLVHGYKGSGNDNAILHAVRSFLQIFFGGIPSRTTLMVMNNNDEMFNMQLKEDANIIVLDWKRGAGANYAVAAANTELVGRQLSLVLMDVINLGTDPKKIHIMGFSLGAHVAGCASEVLKKRQLLVERITGLDPASPLFRRHLVRERSRKLDVSDARFVDIIHTDGSEIFTDGFGLLKPMGHVDFFPNGGREQPGCADVKNSVVVSHLNDGSLNRNLVCSHLRAWTLFVESIRSQRGDCKFRAWPCHRNGSDSFHMGTCFPKENNTPLYPEMGYKASLANQGVFYLATTAKEPYCGDAVRAAITTSPDIGHVSGTLNFVIRVGKAIAAFKIHCVTQEGREGPFHFYKIAAIEFGTFSINSTVNSISGILSYDSSIGNENNNTTIAPFESTLKLDNVVVEDRKGNKWEYHQSETVVDNQLVTIELHRQYII